MKLYTYIQNVVGFVVKLFLFSSSSSLLMFLKFFYKEGEEENTFLVITVPLSFFYTEKKTTILQFTKGSKLFTDYSPRFRLFSKDPSTVYVH